MKKKKKKPQGFLILKKGIGRKTRIGITKTLEYMNRFSRFSMGAPLEETFNFKPPRSFKRAKRFFRRLRHPFVLFLATVFVILMLGIAWLTNSSIHVENVTVPVAGLADDLNGYVILLISDLHGRSFGQKQATLLRSINNERFDLAVFAGDMVGKSGNAQPFYDLIDGMPKSKSLFFIPGDSDPQPILSVARETEGATLSQLVLADWILGAQERGAAYLSCTTQVPVGSSSLWLTPADALCVHMKDVLYALEEELAEQTEGASLGIGADYDGQPLTQYRYNQMDRQIESAKKMNSADLHIAVSHVAPMDEYLSSAQSISFEDEISLSMPDIVLSGHYCGGGWILPGYGALYIPNGLLPRHGWFPDQKIVSGVRNSGAVTICTTAGLSVTDRLYLPKFRLFNEPAIMRITLVAQLDSSLK
ncbi:MAG: metallophosphoesterase [Christensenellales bacterium]|jgi:hypothetical protein